jgi:HIV Tat-specific factor 1
MSKRDEQIARMKGLMTYGISNTSKKTPVTESVEGADGKVYAIIREGSKFYIKSTQNGSELVTESFDYIGGFMNKKNNEFSSYNQASKNLELKLRSINEAYGVNKPVELLNPDKKEELVCEMTDSMKASIARYRQIMNNASMIMNESSTISKSNTGNPEAPKTTAFSPKLGEPFTNTAEAKLDSDLKTTANNPEKQGEPFGDNSKAEEYKDAQYVPDGSVANKKPSGGKVVRVNENEEFEETIEECEEWGSCGLPSSEGVGEVGDDAPFTETVYETLEENNFFHNDAVADDEQLPDVPDEVNINEESEDFIGFSDDDETVEEGNDEEDIDLDDIDLDLDSDEMEDEELDDIDAEETLDDEGELEDVETEIEDSEEDEMDELSMLRSEVEELRELVNQLMGDNDFEDEEPEYELEVDDEDDFDEESDEEFDLDDENDFDEDYEDDFEDEDYEGEDDFEDMQESRKIVNSIVESVLKEEGTKLNVFGKHPGYRKKVMSLPQTGSDNDGSTRDWNDDSVYSEQPFGEKIGSSAPFEKAINSTVDSIVESLKKKL